MRLWLFSAFFVFILGLSGCLVLKQGTDIDIQRPVPSETLRFSDIPSPAGFKILSDKSFILETGSVRAGVLKYTGRGNVEDIVYFYKNKMPDYNWILLNVLEHEEYMLNFERGDESCIIRILPKEGKIEILVSLAPKSPVPVSTEAKDKVFP